MTSSQRKEYNFSSKIPLFISSNVNASARRAMPPKLATLIIQFPGKWHNPSDDYQLFDV
jgi:hypothetical protein